MPHYSGIVSRFSAGSRQAIETTLVPELVEEWLADYDASFPNSDIVETTTAGFSYLFDIASGRLLAAWGFSQGRHSGARDKSRMAGHPLSAGGLYHRGHAIPHTLGGPTDINLVPQLGAVNIGPFRALERQAVATPGALYFTYWQYSGQSQTPIAVDQGLVVPGQMPVIRTHAELTDVSFGVGTNCIPTRVQSGNAFPTPWGKVPEGRMRGAISHHRAIPPTAVIPAKAGIQLTSRSRLHGSRPSPG